MNNQYPRLLSSENYHNPSPRAPQPLAFDNRGWYGGNTGVPQMSTLGEAYTPNIPYNNAVPQVPTTPIGNATGYVPTPSLGAATGMQTYAIPTPTLNGAPQGAMGGIGNALSGLYDKGRQWLGGPGKDAANRVGQAAQLAGDNAQTAWGKMSYGEKGTAALGAATSLYGAYNARKTGKLAKEQFNFTKDSFNRNFEAQAKTTNSQLADRQASRVARDPKAYASVDDYMKKYGV